MQIPDTQLSQITKITTQISDDLVKEIYQSARPSSIILKGSFGRGEPSYLENPDGSLTFLSDFEIELISTNFLLEKFNFLKKHKTNLIVSKKYNIKIDIGGTKLSLYNICPFLYATLKPTIANYDLKYGSILLYGNDIRKKIPDFSSEDIPIEEGIRLIVNRVAEAMLYFDHYTNNNSKDFNDIDQLFFWTNKIVLACQDAILIKYGKYHYSYVERNKIFTRLMSDRGLELNEIIPQFVSLAEKATNYKINPKKRYVENSLEFWFKIIPFVQKILIFLIQNEKKDFADVPAIKILDDFFIGSKKGFHISNKITIFIKYWLNQNKIIPLSLIKRMNYDWTQLFYFVILCTYFSTEKNDPENFEYRRISQKILDEINGQVLKNEDFSEIPFQQLSQSAIYYWKSICY